MNTLILDTGVANIASVRALFARMGIAADVQATPENVLTSELVVLPGVGSFEAGMQALRELNVIDALRQRIAEDKPTLTVCLGLQLLCESSEESPGVEGLGVLAKRVERFPSELRVPQLGWNKVKPKHSNSVFEEGYAYFANSYRIAGDLSESGFEVARCNYGGEFVAGFRRSQLLACQFHPELSGVWGEKLIRRWMREINTTC